MNVCSCRSSSGATQLLNIFLQPTLSFTPPREFALPLNLGGSSALLYLPPLSKVYTTSAHVPSGSKRGKECDVCFWKWLGASTYHYIKKSTILSDGFLGSGQSRTRVVPRLCWNVFLSKRDISYKCFTFCGDILISRVFGPGSSTKLPHIAIFQTRSSRTLYSLSLFFLHIPVLHTLLITWVYLLSFKTTDSPAYVLK